jgi:hypothetical protein
MGNRMKDNSVEHTCLGTGSKNLRSVSGTAEETVDAPERKLAWDGDCP